MRKILISVMALFFITVTAMAQNVLTVDNVTLPQNGEADVTVRFSFEESYQCSGYSFWLQAPTELSFVTYEKNSKTYVTYTQGNCYDDTPTITPNIDGGYLKVGCLTANSDPLNKKSGVLVTFRIKPNGELPVGSSYTCTLTEGTLSNEGGTSSNVANTSFTVTISEPENFDILLDENSTNNPTSYPLGKTVKVKRTINANKWSTICLPFRIITSKLKAAFGDDYQLAKLSGYTKDDDGISVQFESQSTALAANQPYIIKTTNPITDFLVTLNSSSSSSIVEDNGYDDETEELLYSFIGTYNSGENVPEKNLFLNDNKFWYSKGNTTIKGLRAYFYFKDILEDYNNSNAAARIKLSVSDDDGKVTKIDPRTMEEIESGKVYNMAGQYMGEVENTDRLPKGVYIVNGKKTVIK